ncbi:O-antigen ligase family protein [Sinimarinibacterium flocculans]|uniref:O-antigen ligase-like membrane protein n=1 Tax=Sinimarinibacterium flocculans TaxID=985250 RepID=A0A318E2K3_9GAMM|nr:O-antigen ligase family protein [Sinimarinibacterium flocculans]PXV65265.1 O-antigen ligase-like membrane protein [Sinimarinibacterium flocculans]
MRTRSESQWLATGIVLLTTCALLLMPLPAGANRPWALAWFELLFAALTGVAVMSLLLTRMPVRLDRLQWAAVIVWLLWLVWIALQAAALPESLLARLAPASRDAYVLVATWEGPVTVAISVDRMATLAHLRESATYFCLFLLILLCARTPRARRWLVHGLILGAVIQALLGAGMTLSGLEVGPFGRKTDYLGSATGTFINRNHFAGYLEIGGSLAVGLLLARVAAATRVTDWRGAVRAAINLVLGHAPLLRIGLLVIVAGLVVSRSRMGNIAFFTALSVGGVLFILRNRGNPLRSLMFLVLVMVIDLAIVGGYVGLDALRERLQPQLLMADQRLATFPDLQRMAAHYLPFGSGLGSFAVAYPQFRSTSVFASNEHAHNDPLQFLIETGVPGVVLLALLVALPLARALQVMRQRRDPQVLGIALGSALAVFSIGVHGLADFNLQIPANAATIVALLALMLGLPSESRRQRRSAGESAEQPPD